MSPHKRFLRREFEVIFSLKSMPLRLRLFRICIAIFVGYLIWNTDWFWPVVLAVLSLGGIIHMVYRKKTKVWTKSWGIWRYFPPEW